MEALSPFRDQINSIDDEIVDLISRRMSVCREVARLKRKLALPVMQPQRVLEVKARNALAGQVKGLEYEFVDGLYELIIREACRLESTLIE